MVFLEVSLLGARIGRRSGLVLLLPECETHGVAEIVEFNVVNQLSPSGECKGLGFASETQVPLPHDQLGVGLLLLVLVNVVDGELEEAFHFSVQSDVEVEDAVVDEVVGEGVVWVGIGLVL